MTDDSLEILDKYAFHPADPAHGLRNYDLGSLKPDQQRCLNKLKMIQRVENENYLQAHPEIKGLISILLRDILRRKPISNVHEIAGSFFTRPVREIADELRGYLVENCYSSHVIDTLNKEIENQYGTDSSDMKSSPESSEMSLESASGVHLAWKRTSSHPEIL